MLICWLESKETVSKEKEKKEMENRVVAVEPNEAADFVDAEMKEVSEWLDQEFKDAEAEY